MWASEGYKPGEAKSADEYAKLDAEDESLARWKASLGIVPGATAPPVGPKVCPSLFVNSLIVHLRVYSIQVTVLTLELDSPTLPAGRKIVFDLKDVAKLADTKKNPIIIKEGIEYKSASGLRPICGFI